VNIRNKLVRIEIVRPWADIIRELEVEKRNILAIWSLNNGSSSVYYMFVSICLKALKTT